MPGGGGGGGGGGKGGGGALVGAAAAAGGGGSKVDEWGDELPPTSELYLPTVALRALLAILRDASLSAYHHRLIAALVYIFVALGEQCAPFLPKVMPTLLAILLDPSTAAAGAASADGKGGDGPPKGGAGPKGGGDGGGGDGGGRRPRAAATTARAASGGATSGGGGGGGVTIQQQLEALAARVGVSPPLDGGALVAVGAAVATAAAGGGGGSGASFTPLISQLMQQLPALVAAMRAHLVPWVPHLVLLVLSAWNGPLLLPVLALLEQLTLTLRHSLTPYAPALVPMLAAVIGGDSSAQRVPSLSALSAAEGFGPTLGAYASLLLPELVRLLDAVEGGSRTESTLLVAIHRLSAYLPLHHTVAALAPQLLRAARRNADGAPTAVSLLCVLACRAGPSWRALHLQAARRSATASPRARRALLRRGAPRPRRDAPRLLRYIHVETARHRRPPPVPVARPKKLAVKQASLRRMWESRVRETHDDWAEWMRRFSVELLRESPSPALRACAPVAQLHAPRARRLFQVGFMACWEALSRESRESLAQCSSTRSRRRRRRPTSSTSYWRSPSISSATSASSRWTRAPSPTSRRGATLRSAALPRGRVPRAADGRGRRACRGFGGAPQLGAAARGRPRPAHRRGDDRPAGGSVAREARPLEDALREYERSQWRPRRARRRVCRRPHARLSALAEWGQLARLADGSWAQLNGAQQREVAPLSEGGGTATSGRRCSRPLLVSAASYEGGFYRAVLVHDGRYDATAQIAAARTAPAAARRRR